MSNYGDFYDPDSFDVSEVPGYRETPESLDDLQFFEDYFEWDDLPYTADEEEMLPEDVMAV